MTPTAPFDVLLGVPSDCSGRFVGCQFMPSALREAGIAQALGLRDDGNLQVVMGDPVRDPDTGVIGIRDLLGQSAVIRDGMKSLLPEGLRPLVLGGDCTVLIGIAAALAHSHPDAGLIFIDGHMDCFDGRTGPTGEGAEMELAVLLGVGAQPLLDFGERVPAFADDRVVVMGPFDRDDAARLGSPDPRDFAPRARIVSADELAADPVRHGREAVASLDSTADGFWVHVDLDVLSSDVLPAVDYPDRRGLNFEQLRDVLRPIFASPALLGASVVILNPTLDDADGASPRRVVGLLKEATQS